MSVRSGPLMARTFTSVPNAAIDADAFVAAVSPLEATTAILTAAWHGRRHCLTLASTHILAAGPAAMLVSIERTSPIYPAIMRSNALCLNILGNCEAGLALRYCGRAGAHGEQHFAADEWAMSPAGLPLLSAATATIECRLVSTMSLGLHVVLGCAVQALTLQHVNAVSPVANEALCKAASA